MLKSNVLTDESLARRLLRLAPTVKDPDDQEALRVLAQQIFDNEHFFKQQQFLSEIQMQQPGDAIVMDDQVLGALTTMVLLGLRHALLTGEIGIHTAHVVNMAYGQLLRTLHYRQNPPQLVGVDAIEMLNNIVTDALTAVKQRLPEEEHELAVQQLRGFEQQLVHVLGYKHIQIAATHEPFPVDDDDDA